MWILLIVLLLVAGVLTGTLSSLFGLGGGLIVVPLLYWIFKGMGLGAGMAMHVAVATSLAVMINTAIHGVIHRYRQGHILMDMVRILLPYIALGAVCGTMTGHWVHGEVLRYLFIAQLVAVTLKAITDDQFRSEYERHDFKAPAPWVLRVFGSIVGFLSVMLGVGGSLFVVPFFRFFKAPMSNASGISLALTPIIAIVGTLGYIVLGWDLPNLPAWSLGYVSVPAWIMLSLGTLVGVPFGMHLNRRMSDARIAKLYILLLAVILISMVV
ncbi:MAG: sulfite exporter TauE/SafE family protein [Gammaproteobacteria bacterium]|nr:sulfite exporter TauE/SafE family protein [Gammaproteobacteria bacterium]